MPANGRELPRHRDGPAFHIDGAEVYRMMMQNQHTLIRVEAQLAALVETVRNGEKDTDTTLEKHDTRLAAVERKVWQLPSIPTVIALGALVVGIVQLAGGG